MQPVKTKKKLSRTDKKQIEAAIARANRTDKKGKSAQDSIPYERMWPDGICRISDSHYPICGGRNGVSSPRLPPLFLFARILAFCL